MGGGYYTTTTTTGGEGRGWLGCATAAGEPGTGANRLYERAKENAKTIHARLLGGDRTDEMANGPKNKTVGERERNNR